MSRVSFRIGFNVEMTAEQENMVRHIATTLNKRYVGGNNRFNASAFIKDNYAEFVKRVREIKASNRRFYAVVNANRRKRSNRRFFDYDRLDADDVSFYY